MLWANDIGPYPDGARASPPNQVESSPAGGFGNCFSRVGCWGQPVEDNPLAVRAPAAAPFEPLEGEGWPGACSGVAARGQSSRGLRYGRRRRGRIRRRVPSRASRGRCARPGARGAGTSGEPVAGRSPEGLDDPSDGIEGRHRGLTVNSTRRARSGPKPAAPGSSRRLQLSSARPDGIHRGLSMNAFRRVDAGTSFSNRTLILTWLSGAWCRLTP